MKNNIIAHTHTAKNFVYSKRFQLGFFAVLISVALLCDALLNYIGSLSQIVSLGTSFIYVMCLVVIGNIGIITISRSIKNPLETKYLIETAQSFPKLFIQLLLPVISLIIGTAASLIFLIIPGLLFIIRSMFMTTEISIENMSLKEAYKSSFTKTSRLTKEHLGFFILFAINQFLFIYSSSTLSDGSFSQIGRAHV